MDKTQQQPSQANDDGKIKTEETPNELPVPDRNKLYREKKKQVKLCLQLYGDEIAKTVDSLKAEISIREGKATWESDDGGSMAFARSDTFHEKLAKPAHSLDKTRQDKTKLPKLERERLRHQRDRALEKTRMQKLCDDIVTGEEMIRSFTTELEDLKSFTSSYDLSHDGNSTLLSATDDTSIEAIGDERNPFVAAASESIAIEKTDDVNGNSPLVSTPYEMVNEEKEDVWSQMHIFVPGVDWEPMEFEELSQD